MNLLLNSIYIGITSTSNLVFSIPFKCGKDFKNSLLPVRVLESNKDGDIFSGSFLGGSLCALSSLRGLLSSMLSLFLSEADIRLDRLDVFIDSALKRIEWSSGCGPSLVNQTG